MIAAPAFAFASVSCAIGKTRSSLPGVTRLRGRSRYGEAKARQSITFEGLFWRG
jgi:hypothetical protein